MTTPLKTRTARLSVISNSLLIAMKLAAGIISGSVSISLHVKDQLGDAIPVAQVNECHSPEVPRALYPSGQSNLLSPVI